MIVQAVGARALRAELAVSLRWIKIDLPSLWVVVEAIPALASAPKGAEVEGTVDLATLRVCLRAITPLAHAPVATRLTRHTLADPLLFALPQTVVDNVLRNCTEPRR